MARRTSRLERVENDFLAALYRKEHAATVAMAQTYQQTVNSLTPLWQEAYRKLQAAKLAGYSDDYLSGFIWQEQRLANLMVQAEQHFQSMARSAGLVLGQAQQDAARLAMASVQASIQSGLGSLAGSVMHAGFIQYPTAQLEAITGRLADGSPLDDLARRYGTSGPAVMRRELIAGIANGEIPTLVARRMSKALGAEYGKLALTARTEMLRVYRDTTHATYKANARLLDGWRWSAAMQDSTCVVCWAMHGRVFPLDEKMATHPACRCSMSPVVKPWSAIDPRLANVSTLPVPESGPDVFRRLPEARQRAIMGPLAHKAYKQNLIQLSDLVQDTYSPQWGAGRTTKSLTRALGPDGIKRLKGGLPPLPKPPAPLPKPRPTPRPKPSPPAPKPSPPAMPGNVTPPAPAPVPTGPVPMVPRGVPVSQGLDLSPLPKSGKYKPVSEDIRATTQLIDSVHGDGDLPGVKVGLNSSQQSYGSYTSQRAQRMRNGQWVTTHEPVSLELSRMNSISAKGHPRMTYAHEVGHYLDQQMIGPMFKGSREVISRQGSLDGLAGYADWQAAVRQSRAYVRLNEVRDLSKQGGYLDMPSPTTGSMRPVKLGSHHEQWLDYTLTDNELFARSYAQYIATRTRDPKMLAELNVMREPLRDAFYMTQWADDDFEPIAKAFDEMFEALGLRVPQP